MSEEHEEVCQRCGESGEDRRTLYMSCFYKMSELGLPFEEKNLFSAPEESVQKEVTLVPYTYRSTSSDGTASAETGEWKKEEYSIRGNVTPINFFLLRVCKRCRADWLGAIKTWFHTPMEEEKECGSGIFIRENGVNKEITREEWDRRYADRKGGKE